MQGKSSRQAAFFIQMNYFLISKFEKQTLSNLVTECFGSDFPDILQKPQVNYIYKYLETLGAQSVLLELNYLDKDYLEDFSRYYVKRFGNAGHQCARMHFFSEKVDHRHIDRLLEAGEGTASLAARLDAAYLGFMVIKPLPKTFIGKTCLKVMSDTHSAPKKKKRLARDYKVDLFGIELNVRSIAFQEQDKVVAACASTAIWSALHTMNWRDVRRIHSCSEITVNAINHIDGSSNSFPSKELTNKQILRSLDVEGLRHHSEDVEKLSRAQFLATVVGHIDSHLPLLLMGNVFAVREHNDLESYGAGHAVCVVGYKVDEEEVIYVHDDRLGPYARAKLVCLGDYEMTNITDSSPEKWALGLQKMDEITGQWLKPHELIVPEFLVMPTDKKARLPFYYADFTSQFITREFGELCQALLPSGTLGVGDLTFTITLEEIASIRQDIRKCVAPRTQLDSVSGTSFEVDEQDFEDWQKDKLKFLKTSFARLQWQSQFFYKSQKAFKVLIDASDIPQGNAVSAVYVDNIALSAPILEVFKVHGNYSSEDTTPGHFYASFLSKLRDGDATLEDYLNETYGALRAPIKLKAQEFIGGKISTNPTRTVIRDPSRLRLDQHHIRFSDLDVEYLIWAIAADGALLIGEEIAVEIDGELELCGHPCITKFRPARIAGELWKAPNGWFLNPKSGRYSGDYEKIDLLLENALFKFQSFFPQDTFWIQPLPPKPVEVSLV